MSAKQERGAVIVTSSGYYFSRWAAAPLRGYDDWDSYHYVPEFTSDPKHAYVYEDRRSAERALPRIKNKGFMAGARVAVVS